MIFEPLDVVARLAALVPRPRVNLTRFHGVFAPNSKYRALISPVRRGVGRKSKSSDAAIDRTPAEPEVAMTWAQWLKRVFNIDKVILFRGFKKYIETSDQYSGLLPSINGGFPIIYA